MSNSPVCQLLSSFILSVVTNTDCLSEWDKLNPLPLQSNRPHPLALKGLDYVNLRQPRKG